MESTNLVGESVANSTTYEVLLLAMMATRFRVRDRWLIAGSFATETEARKEFANLAREFPGDSISLKLIRSEPDESLDRFRERLLDQREPAVLPDWQRRRLRVAPGPQHTARQRGTIFERPIIPSPPTLTSGVTLHFRLACSIAVASLLVSLMLQ